MSGCQHCGAAIPAERRLFCCDGCETVHALLHAGGLERFYQLGRGERPDEGGDDFDAARGPWLDQLMNELDAEDHAGGLRTIELDVAGIHCAACVWLVQETFARRAAEGGAGGHVDVNPALARATLRVTSDFPLRDWINELRGFGYRPGPVREGEHAADRANGDLLIRTTLSLALAGNVMLFALAEYVGLRGGRVHEFTQALTFGASTLSVLIGGTVFMRSAWASVRARAPHFDVPIALGITLAYAGATHRFFFGDGEVAYLDTVSVFIALMLVGRFLQERALDRSRRRLLEDPSADALLTRVQAEDDACIVPVSALQPGDELVLRPRDLVPVAARALQPVRASLEWINGESDASEFDEGEEVPAGAFVVSPTRAQLVARETFAESAVRRLLRRDARPVGADTRFWARAGLGYTALVLVAGLGAAVLVLAGGGTTSDAIARATAVLVVTCPCAFGIAIPLAREWTHAQLRRRGVFVRRPGALERLAAAKRVLFDKTGTLTAGTLRFSREQRDALVARFAALSPRERQALATLLVAQDHPKANALHAALAEHLPAVAPEARVDEHPGRGVSTVLGGETFTLGEPRWLGTRRDRVDADDDVAFAHGGVVLFVATTEEYLRDDAHSVVNALRADEIAPYIVSGDRESRVARVAERLGFVPDDTRVVAEATPAAKAALVASFDDGGTVMIGDGLNDARAFDAADCAITPAAGRPFVATRCDLYLGGTGLGGVLVAIERARRLRHVIRVDLMIALTYNALAISFALAGWMRPWLAALLMPASSLLTLAVTRATLGPLDSMSARPASAGEPRALKGDVAWT